MTPLVRPSARRVYGPGATPVSAALPRASEPDRSPRDGDTAVSSLSPVSSRSLAQHEQAAAAPIVDRDVTVPIGSSKLPVLAPSLVEGMDGPDRYTPLRLLGSGGMGQVYECVDHALGRRVALKQLRPEVASDPLAVAMLEREGRVIGRLEHPNIVPIYDAGHRESTGPYYAMRLLQRLTLEAVLRQLRDGHVPTQESYGQGRLLRAFVQVCQAVDFAHDRNVIHCDLKPSNILLGPFGEVLVVDWGLAYCADEGIGYRGGTPGYMAPEQMDGQDSHPIDARTDVYALGAILYEILTYRHAFPESVEGQGPARGYLSPERRPTPPMERAPERGVPEELAEICMKALAVDPAARYGTAQALAEAIETFLEGKQERERREARALEYAYQGDDLAERYDELMDSRPERLRALQVLQASVAPWADAGEKQLLWDAEDRQSVLEALCIRTFQAVVAAYEQALEEWPRCAEARRGLARLYRAELMRALERRDPFDRVYFEGMLEQFEGSGEAPLSLRGGALTIEASEPVDVVLGHFKELGRRLVEVRTDALGQAPLVSELLPSGSYVARVSKAGAFEVRCPVFIKPGTSLTLTLNINELATLRPGEVFVAGGPALLGESGTRRFARDLREVDVPSFFIGELPVSFRDYFAFLAEAYAQDPIEAVRFLPCHIDGSPYWRRAGEGFAPAGITRWYDDLDTLLSLPCFGVDIACVEAYAAWLSARTGFAYRLPDEWEWEKAARGTDGRRFPWGDRFDASFCKMRESRPDRPRPEPCGAFAHDVSPFGVRDMAGGVAEWVLPSPESVLRRGVPSQIISRGGAWCDWRGDCTISARRVYMYEERSARVGFRLARSATR